MVAGMIVASLADGVSAGDFEPGGECYQSDDIPENDVDDLLDELDS